MNEVNWWRYYFHSVVQMSVCAPCTHSELVAQTVVALNADSSKMVKATYFEFDTLVSRVSPDMIP